jgi:hypothetical protein
MEIVWPNVLRGLMYMDFLQRLELLWLHSLINHILRLHSHDTPEQNNADRLCVCSHYVVTACLQIKLALM